MNETKRTTTPFDNKGNQPKWKEIAIGGTTGILLAGAGVALTSFDTPSQAEEGSADDVADNNVAEESAATGGAATNYDEMSFADAFAAARAEMGPGGVFTWHGNSYGTYLKSEWDAMDNSQRDEFADNAAGGNAGNQESQDHQPANEDVAHAGETTTSQQTQQQQSGGANQQQQQEVAQNTEQHQNGAIDPQIEGGDEPGTFDVDSEIEFVSFEQVELMGDGTVSNVGTAVVNGQEVLLIDVDGDGGNFDLMAADFNNNGQLEDNEIVDISDQQISVEGFAQSVGSGATFESGEGTFISDEELGITDTESTDDMAMDADMPDYVNDAEPGDFVG